MMSFFEGVRWLTPPGKYSGGLKSLFYMGLWRCVAISLRIGTEFELVQDNEPAALLETLSSQPQ
jgi:hypothetical protein